MLGEIDGPSNATTGATYGVGFFVPFILLTFVMAFVVQEMTVRLATATWCAPAGHDTDGERDCHAADGAGAAVPAAAGE
jgi:hypothetical protein